MLTLQEQPGTTDVLADVTACPACGQLIAGLPPAGACPECGQPYDRRELVVFGRRSRWWWWPWASPVVAWLFLAAMFVQHGWHLSDLGYATFGAAAAIESASVMVARFSGNRPGSARLRLSASGCRLDIEAMPPPLARRVIVAAAVAVVTRRWPRGTARPAWDVGEFVPWPQVRHVRLTPAGQGRWRVRVGRPGTAPGRRVVVDIVANLAPEQLAATRAFAGQSSAVTA